MIDDASYLQDVVVLESRCHCNLLRNNQRILEIFIRNVVKLLAVVYHQQKYERYDANDQKSKPTLRDHERVTACERVYVQKGEACIRCKGSGT